MNKQDVQVLVDATIKHIRHEGTRPHHRVCHVTVVGQTILCCFIDPMASMERDVGKQVDVTNTLRLYATTVDLGELLVGDV